MNMCINAPFQFEIILPDGSPRYNILINGYVYNFFAKSGVMRIMHNSPNGGVNYHILYFKKGNYPVIPIYGSMCHVQSPTFIS